MRVNPKKHIFRVQICNFFGIHDHPNENKIVFNSDKCKVVQQLACQISYLS